jgi:hypothetical protein
VSKADLSDYIEVSERVALFMEKHPDGSLQGEWEVQTIGEDTLIVYTARAYRSGNDHRPGEGRATEPYPGRTNFTKGSELMNAETSAWGRAIAAVGIVASRRIATAQEIRANEQEVKAKQEAGEALPTEKIEELGKLMKDSGVAFDRLCLIFTAAGADPPAAKRKDSIRKAFVSLTPAQAEKIAATLEGLAQ